MKFGIDLRHKKTGAHIAVIIFQIVSLLPLPYIFSAPGYIALLNKRNALTVLFEFGINALPRWEALLLSSLYRLFSSEIAPYFAIIVIALITGIVSKRVLAGNIKLSIVLHYVFGALIIIDIVLRFIPFSFNSQFPLAFTLGAAAVRIVCLALLTGDIVAYKRQLNTDTNK